MKKLVFIDIYRENVIRSEEYCTFAKAFSVETLCVEDRPRELLRSKLRILWLEIKFLFILIWSSKKIKDAIVFVNGMHMSTMLYLRFARVFDITYKVCISNLYFHGITKYKLFGMLLKFLFTGNDYLVIVQSPSEIEYYKNLGGNANCKLVPYSMPDLRLDKDKNQQQNYFFSGGYTNRDYNLLFKLATLFPLQNFVFVASRLNKLDLGRAPNNVQIYLDTTPAEFHTWMINSMCVVIPLKENVGSSGQMLCHAAMQLAKPIIYSDYDVVAQYFLTENAGIKYIPGDIDSLHSACTHFLNISDAERKAIGNSACDAYKTYFSNKVRTNKILSLVLTLN